MRRVTAPSCQVYSAPCADAASDGPCLGVVGPVYASRNCPPRGLESWEDSAADVATAVLAGRSVVTAAGVAAGLDGSAVEWVASTPAFPPAGGGVSCVAAGGEAGGRGSLSSGPPHPVALAATTITATPAAATARGTRQRTGASTGGEPLVNPAQKEASLCVQRVSVEVLPADSRARG